MLPKLRLFIAGTFGGVLAIILIGAILISIVLNNGTGLTDAQKKAILAEIIKNNSSNLIGQNENGSSLATAQDSAGKLAAPLIVRPDSRDYNYRYSKVTYTNGPAIDKCKLFDFGNLGSYTSEQYEFYGDGNTYSSKYLTKDSSGNLNTYTVTNTNANDSQTIEYRGGSYAVQWDYNFAVLDVGKGIAVPNAQEDSSGNTSSGTAAEPVSAPEVPTDTVTPPVDQDALILQYFGPDADIVNVINQNGKDYYVIQYSYNVDCSVSNKIIPLAASASSSSSTFATQPDKIIVQNIVDSTNFEIVKNYYYLENTDNSSLLNTYETTTQTQNTTFDQVKDQFKFEYSVNVKKLTYEIPTAESQAQDLISFLNKQDLPIVLLNSPSTNPMSVYSSQASRDKDIATNYLYDRNFYPAGDRGDAMLAAFENSTGNLTAPILSTYYALNTDSTYDTLNIDLYGSDFNITDLVPADSTNTKSSALNIVLDGTNIAGTLYTTTYSNLVSSGGAGVSSDSSSVQVVPPTAPDVSSTYSTRQFYFEKSGYKYLISFPSRDTFDLTTLNFKTIKTSNSSDMSAFGELIKETYQNQFSPGGTGVSTPGSTGTVEPNSKPAN